MTTHANKKIFVLIVVNQKVLLMCQIRIERLKNKPLFDFPSSRIKNIRTNFTSSAIYLYKYNK